jgi:hypothetical protein
LHHEIARSTTGRSDRSKRNGVVRLWAANGKLDVIINVGAYHERGFDEAIAWGVIISDFTRHVAKALAQRYGKDEQHEMVKVRDSFLRELADPTSRIKGE